MVEKLPMVGGTPNWLGSGLETFCENHLSGKEQQPNMEAARPMGERQFSSLKGSLYASMLVGRVTSLDCFFVFRSRELGSYSRNWAICWSLSGFHQLNSRSLCSD